MQFAQAGPYLETFVIARGAAAQIFKILDAHAIINASKNRGETPQDVKGTIEFKDVHFHYPSRPNVKVLYDFKENFRKKMVYFIFFRFCKDSI